MGEARRRKLYLQNNPSVIKEEKEIVRKPKIGKRECERRLSAMMILYLASILPKTGLSENILNGPYSK